MAATGTHAQGGAHPHVAATFAGSTAEGVRALKIGVAGLALTSALQAVLLFFSGSVALLGDTLHNGVDVIGTAIVWVALVVAGRARNERFSFGYHRFEDLAGLVVVALIAGSAALVVFESASAFGGGGSLERPWIVFAAGLVGFAGNEGVARFKIHAGRRIGSAALEADGRHSRVDGLSSIGVVVAALGSLSGVDWLDATVGLGIGLFIAWTAAQSGRAVLFRLVDRADPALRRELEAVAQEVPDMGHLTDIRLRQTGRTVNVIASVCMPADYPVGRAHDTAEDLRLAWLNVLPPGSMVDIHVEPYTPGEHSPHSTDATAATRHR